MPADSQSELRSMNIVRVGVGIAKSVFLHVHVVDRHVQPPQLCKQAKIGYASFLSLSPYAVAGFIHVKVLQARQYW